MDAGVRPEVGGRASGAVPAPGGGSSQPCREWTMGSHSPRPPQGRRALQLAGAWRLAGTCGQRLHSLGGSVRGGEQPRHSGGSASRNPDRGRRTPRTYPSADPQPRAG